MVRHPFARPTTTVLSGVTCEIRAGEFFGLLGPNGAGKTTFLKILATLIEADEGTARVGGHDVVRDAAQVRAFMAPCLANERSLLWRLSARENLTVFADLLGIPPRDIARHVAEALEAVGLSDTGEKLAGQFSSGMMQRLLVARALLTRPGVLLLDEPTRSLDPISARELRRFLREELVERRGCGVLLATHNAEEAFELCDRVGVLHRGRLLATGTALELTQRYLGARYRLVTRQPDHQAIAALQQQRRITTDGRLAEVDGSGWATVELRLVSGDDDAPAVLARLVTAGVPVARFEARALSLADLIAAVVAAEEGAA
jgi:ABC-2 type transport system ATP-binding protein